ncbi:MAG: hypothetical protein HQ515_04405 [Phycisphaeraceae bacterium]|nr:hypothetical protein [Phycisphaeraceae bacterium]
MKTSKVMFAGIVIILASAMIWYVGFNDKIDLSGAAKAESSSKDKAEPNEPNQSDPNGAAQLSDSNEPNNTPLPKPESSKPAKNTGEDPNTKPEGPSDPNAKQDKAKKQEDPNTPKDPNELMEALNLNEVAMKDIVTKITDWTGKGVIPVDDAMKQKITIFLPKKVTRAEALSHIYSALRTKGYVATEADNLIYLEPIANAKQGRVPIVGIDDPLASFVNKDQIVQKFFRLKNYSPTQMLDKIKPLVDEYGMVSVDETTSTVTVIETVSNLRKISQIIDVFDVPESDQTAESVVVVQYRDPAEIVQMVRMLFGGQGTSRQGSSSNRGYNPYGNSRGSSSRGSSQPEPVKGPSGQPIFMFPMPQRQWIIVRASAQDMVTVKDWIEKLDTDEEMKSENETVQIRYADVGEVAERIETVLSEMSGNGMTPSVIISPFAQSRKIMISGRVDMRDMVKSIISEIDQPTGEFEQQTITLKYSDPDQIKENIDSLYGEEEYTGYDSYYYYRYGAGSRSNPGEKVSVISFPTMQQVTVTASPEYMRRIEIDIEKWDQPLDVDAVKPRIIELRNSDPVQLSKLLTKLFSEDQGDDNNDWMRYIFGRGNNSDSKKKIVGPLYGQLTFADVPGTKKLIVISKVPEAYKVIEDLIAELDGQEMAEVPEVIQLKYADPERLAERLNALFNPQGTTARIRFSDQGLGSNSEESQDRPGNNNGNRNNNNNNQNQNPGYFQGYWSQQGGRFGQNESEEPISNVIGKVRFIPDTHSKSILVLAVPEFMDSIREMIEELDVPGKQVLIKAIVLEVDHSSMTSLGVQLSTNTDSFGEVGENAVKALTELQFLETRGSGSITAGADIYALIDFLEKNVNAKILNQQSLWTKDNEMATFFKGDIVPFEAGSSFAGNSDRTQSNNTFEPVGMRLEVRPSITPEDRVDMEVRVELSQLKDEIVNGQPVRGSMETDTKMIVNSGETIMLGGILFQKDSLVKRKVPLLGDIPLVGMLFRHQSEIQTNNELIIFIIPEVIDDGAGTANNIEELMEKPLETLDNVRETINRDFEKAGIVDTNED